MSYPTKEELNTKWWHRLLKVLLVLIGIVVFGLSFLNLYYDVINKLPSLDAVVITDNLNAYTQRSDQKVINTISNFSELEGRTGCVNRETQMIDDVSSLGLFYSICNQNMAANKKEIAEYIKSKNSEYYRANLDVIEEMILSRSQDIDPSTGGKRICLLYKSVDCTSSDIVKYQLSNVERLKQYSLLFIYSILITMMWAIGLSALYRVALYVVYGKKK